MRACADVGCVDGTVTVIVLAAGSVVEVQGRRPQAVIAVSLICTFS